MAKKAPKSQSKSKKLAKSTTMKNTIEQAQTFLNQSKKKKSLKTKTMAQTIKEGKNIMKVVKQEIQKKKTQKKDSQASRSKSVKEKNPKKKGKKIKKQSKLKNKSPALLTKKKKAQTTNVKKGKKVVGNNKSIKDKTKKNKKPTKSTKSGKKTQPTPVIAVPQKKQKKSKKIAPSASNLSSGSISKKVIFKTKSKQHLPIPAFGFIDVCFCIDATSSMSSYLAQAQSTIISIMEKIQNKVRTQGITLRFAVVTYRDHPPQDSTYVTKFLDFTDEKEAVQYVKKLEAYGGGDYPQAVHDGLINACNQLNWVQLAGTPMLRYIFHVADAPPHGSQFGNSGQKDGCLCGKKTNDIFHSINSKQIHYRLIKARNQPQVNTMQQVFKKGIVDFQSADITNAKQMDVKVSDMIIHEILPPA